MSTIYYKATRPDGTDFHTGTIPYIVGKRVRPHSYLGTPRVCGPGVLHAADVPAMTLVGGSWPCRLFEVTGKLIVGFDSNHRHKGGFKQLTVVRELDAHLALGPNGRYVAGVIERSCQLTGQEALDLRAARDAAWDAALDLRAAWDAALAMLVRDLITPEQFDVLYGPWAKVIEKAPMSDRSGGQA